MIKAVAILLSVAFATRQRRESEFRLQHGTFIPKSIRTFSPFRDNVVTMVALRLKDDGLKGREMRTALESVFGHGCHCSWNKGRHTLKKHKGFTGVDNVDSHCMDFEHCAECLKMDGCDIEAEFSPEFTDNGFSCDHLQEEPCKYHECLCSRNLADKLTSSFTAKTDYNELSFTDFMDKCVDEVDASINTQMTEEELAKLSRSEYKSERQCCGPYPNRRAFTHKAVVGTACCNDRVLYSLKSQQCCKTGVQSLGDVCWD